ncbi:MAG: hypothetical protein H0W24_09250 [Lysobacter sp.]|nr:hypothetical protein [Lysobacter sp.]
MDLSALRTALHPLIEALKDHGPDHALGSLCQKLTMPVPPEMPSKRKRLLASLAAVPDTDLPKVAAKLLDLYSPAAAARNRIEDLLHPDGSRPSVPMRYRRELARELSTTDLFRDAGRFDALLARLWDIDYDPMGGWAGLSTVTLRDEIERHVHRNPGDWEVEYLFDRLGVFEASDWRFNRFIEGLASSAVRPDEPSQRKFVAIVNRALRPCQVELRETGTEGGYPSFDVVSMQAPTRGTPKNLIFASRRKPDLRFRDALDNDIEVVSGAEDVLVYDRPISVRNGLLWRDLQAWWAERNHINEPEAAKRALYKRLQQCLPDNSPPQSALFQAYYEAMRHRLPDAPALLPEVWLHWDPKTVKARGKDALLRFRMDFLLLFPHGHRVVIEVDGRHHYADHRGLADTAQYAQLVRADRELKLAGYEVFRFGATELQEPEALNKAKKFFVALCKRLGADG